MPQPSRLRFVSLATLTIAALAGCSSEAPPEAGGLDGLTVVGEDPTDIPLDGAAAPMVERFLEGDRLFDRVFRDADGIGPLYIRTACGSCHEGAARGPGAVQKAALVEADGVTPLADQSAGLPYGHTLRPYTTAGATTPITAPDGAGVKVSLRLGPAVFGRGYLEAVADSEIERVEAEQSARSDGIHGRINRVAYASKPNPGQPYHMHTEGESGLIGRFGLKGRVATLDEFTADAFQGDMGVTSPMRPVEPPNPEALSDDGRGGVDVTLDVVNAVADYMRLLEIPRRDAPPGAAARGPALFAAAKCDVCHAPSLKTRPDYPIALLAGIEAPIFTDLLLHEMGAELADGLTDGAATSSEWKTAPLIGLRHLSSFMHDGRAKTVEQAILLHGASGSEAASSVQAFESMTLEERADLLDYVRAL